jgi:hypothetical protein
MRVDARGSAGLGGVSIAIVEEGMPLVRRYSASLGARRGVGGRPVTFLFTGVAILALTACGDKNAYVAPPPPKVVAAQPLQQPVTRYIELTGNTQAINTVDLEARVQGFLEKINYVDGALVKKDQVLFEIQRNTYEAQLEQAKATLAGNQAGQLNAQIEYDRQSQLQQKQVSTTPSRNSTRRLPVWRMPRPVSSSPRSTSAIPRWRRRSTASPPAISSRSARWSAMPARPS